MRFGGASRRPDILRRGAAQAPRRVVVADHGLRHRDDAQPQAGGSDVDVVDHRIGDLRVHLAAAAAVDDEGDADRLLVGGALVELAVAAAHLAVVREEDDIGVAVHPQVDQRLADAADVPIQVLDLSVVAGQFGARFFLHPGHGGHVAAQLDLRRAQVPGGVRRIGGRHVGPVRRLHREHGEEGLILLSPAANVIPQVLDQHVAEGIGHVAAQPPRPLAAGAVDVVLVLVVGGLVADPVAKAAAPLRRDVVVGVVGAVQMPLSDIGGVVAGDVERGGHGGRGGRQPDAVGHHAGLVRVAATEQRAAERRAPRRAGHRAVEAHALAPEVVEVGRGDVGIAPLAGGLGTMLVAKDPQHVGSPQRRQRHWVIHLRTRLAAVRPRGERGTGETWPAGTRVERRHLHGLYTTACLEQGRVEFHAVAEIRLIVVCVSDDAFISLAGHVKPLEQVLDSIRQHPPIGPGRRRPRRLVEHEPGSHRLRRRFEASAARSTCA